MRKRVYNTLEENSLAKSSPESDTPPTNIHNLVGTTELWCSCGKINLEYIAMLPCTFYDKTRFAAITIRISDPSCTALLFTSGKLVLTGATSWLQCLRASLSIARMLSRACPGVVFRVVDTQVQNIVGKTVVPLPENHFLDLRAMYEELASLTCWQPNMFPGLVLRAPGPVVLLLFFSGRVVITGGRCERDIEEGWVALWPTVRRFIRPGKNQITGPPRKRRRTVVS